MVGRNLRCRLDLKLSSDKEVVKLKQEKAIECYNGKKQREFLVGDKVMIKQYLLGGKESWVRVTISKAVGLKSYECKTDCGKTQIRLIDQTISAQMGSEDQGGKHSSLPVTPRQKRNIVVPVRFRD